MIRTEAELEERLSRPSEADIAFARELSGDLLILGAGGKMGPSLACRAARAAAEAGVRRRVIAVSRFGDPEVRRRLADNGVEVIVSDLLDDRAMSSLPDAENVVYMAARKFGTTGYEHLTWALNVLLPARVAERFRDSRIVAFSTGNVYPLVPVASGGATEALSPAPLGEYAQSALGRERIFEYFSARYGTRVTLLRLNYAAELRYGVLYDIAAKVLARQPVPVTMAAVNVIWQGDANSIALRSFRLCASPPTVLNLTGAEILLVRELARRFAKLFDCRAAFEGREGASALLSNASRCRLLFGAPEVDADTLADWTAEWLRQGGRGLDRPTHFEVRDGQF